MSFQLEGLDEINRTFNNIKKGMNSRELNIARAKAFKKFTINNVRGGKAAIMKIKPATVKISGRNHQPEWFTGSLLKAMRVKGQKDGSAEAGYFSSDPTKMRGTDKTTFQIALLQHTGYRIPLQGEKGERVRKFLMVHGIFPKKTRKFLFVFPRPFLFMSEIDYRQKTTDFNITDKFVREMMDKL
jgi:hypothetical protein